jgi:hypothetical protein
MTTPITLSPLNYAGVVLLSALLGAGLMFRITRYRRDHRAMDLLCIVAGCCYLPAIPLMFAGVRAGELLFAAATLLLFVGDWALVIRDWLAARRRSRQDLP